MLVEADRANGYSGTAASSSIAVLSSKLAGHLRVLDLPGNFGVDAVSSDGHYLYLVQHHAGEHYTVRAYDLKLDQLVQQPVVDKREPNENMQGLPLARTQNRSWALTLYRRPSGVPFVHALMLNSLFAFCIDLPASARVGASVLASWGVATQGTKLFVANAGSGWVGVVQLANFSVQYSASLGAQPRTGTVTRPLAASPDGTRLYLARPQSSSRSMPRPSCRANRSPARRSTRWRSVPADRCCTARAVARRRRSIPAPARPTGPRSRPARSPSSAS